MPPCVDIKIQFNKLGEKKEKAKGVSKIHEICLFHAVYHLSKKKLKRSLLGICHVKVSI